MREILFRGKRIDNGEWVDGYYVETLRYNNLHWIWDGKEYIAVDHNTVCQYTGLTDKNGVKIFEGDIMRLCSATYPCLVYWDGRGWAWLANGKRRDIDLTRDRMDIIGNIHDNPELLEGGTDNG